MKLSSAILLFAVAPLMMTIGGCATLPGTPPLAVAIPADCDRIAAPVPYPPVVKNEDLGVRAAKYVVALKTANGKLIKVRLCNAKVRAAFARGSARAGQ